MESKILTRPFMIENDHFLALPPQDGNRASLYDNFIKSIIKDNGHHYIITVIFVGQKRDVSARSIEKLLNEHGETDDVLQSDFLKGVLFTYTGPGSFSVPNNVKDYLREIKGTKLIKVRRVSSHREQMLSGPCLQLGDKFLPIWKVYEDSNHAFLEAIVPGTNSEPSQLRIAGIFPQSLSVAVPCRPLMMDSDLRRPLEGWRIAVKDNFDIQGMKTSACNKDYYKLYQPALATARCISLLEDAGAVILGKTKLASLAATEEPVECIDWPAPWNPRADGYQSPAGSSSGSGVAIAAYKWLDISIGSDIDSDKQAAADEDRATGMAALQCGLLMVFSLMMDSLQVFRKNRITLYSVTWIEISRRFDTPTFFGRNLEWCKQFANEWYAKNLPPNPKKPNSTPAIIFPQDYMFKISNSDQKRVIERFMSYLELYLKVERKIVSFDELWDSAPPEEAKGHSVQEYMQGVCRNSFFYDDYHNFDKFREDHQRGYSTDPYVSPPVRWQWDLSSKITLEERDTAVERLEIYRKWFLETVMREKERNSLVIIPIEKISPRYRDEVPSEHFNPEGVPNLFLSPILGAPELTVPIGTVPYESRISGKTEALPMAISIIGLPSQLLNPLPHHIDPYFILDFDLELFDIALGCLKQAGRPTSVEAGKNLFPPDKTSPKERQTVTKADS
ncbi:MAG: hypothetical protein M1820_001503 [Bogoriella megaspora]|nr:MAG: hypothetical protein M1820_001503 [Bogoriella megaspora]